MLRKSDEQGIVAVVSLGKEGVSLETASRLKPIVRGRIGEVGRLLAQWFDGEVEYSQSTVYRIDRKVATSLEIIWPVGKDSLRGSVMVEPYFIAIMDGEPLPETDYYVDESGRMHEDQPSLFSLEEASKSLR